MKPWAEEFYKSQAWKICREVIMQRDHYLCQDCLKQNKFTAAEEVHHIIELTPENIQDPEVTLNSENLISLCRECHRARHGARQRRYKIDEFGRVTIPD